MPMNEKHKTPIIFWLIFGFIVLVFADSHDWIDLDGLVRGNQAYNEPVNAAEPVNQDITVVRATPEQNEPQIQVVIVQATNEPTPVLTLTPAPMPTAVPTKVKATTTTQIGEERPTGTMDAIENGLHNLWYSITH